MAPYGWLTLHTTAAGTWTTFTQRGGYFAYEGSWSAFDTSPRRAEATQAIEDRPGFRQQRGARPAHKSINERISRKPRALE